MALETIDPNKLAEFFETVFLDQKIENHGQSDPVQYVVGSVDLLHDL